MRIYANINEYTLRRRFNGPRQRRRPLVVRDHTLPGFSLTIAADDTRTFSVRVRRKLGVVSLPLGKAAELTAAKARARAAVEIEAAQAERQTGPLFCDFADEFMLRQARRWKPATRRSNAAVLRRHLLPAFGHIRVADIARTDVERWFDSMSGAPGTANRALPVLSVMMTQAGLWDVRPQDDPAAACGARGPA